MVEVEERTASLTEYNSETIRILRHDILNGKNWYLALLEAIGRWNTVEETIDGRRFIYLIAGEAFDWLLLGERLCATVEGLIPQQEKENLLFYGKAPVNLTNDEFQSLLGATKYKQYLNFFYGVTIEGALFLVTRDKLRKGKMASLFRKTVDCDNESFIHLYGEDKKPLLKQFRKGKGYSQKDSIGLQEMNEFLYWLFKYRLEHCDKSRVASDTKSAMEYLKEQYVRVLRAADND